MPQGGRQFVFRLADGPDQDSKTAQRVEVKIGIRQPGRVEITEGLQPGDLIVTAGQQRIQRDGMAVRVVEVPGQAGAGGAPANGAPVGAAPWHRARSRSRPRPPLRSPTPATRAAWPWRAEHRTQERTMQLPEIAIRRPVFATVLSLLVVLIGAVSFNRLSVREYPKIDEPVVTVSVKYAGASAEVIESQVTKPLEDSIAGIDAVDVITSISRPEQSQISVRFRLEKDADAAAAEVRDRTSRVRNKLPQAIDEPVIAKVEADAFPVMWLAFTSETPHAAADQRPGQPHRQAAPADRHRRGRRAHLRRAQVRHARLARPGQAGRPTG